MEFDLVPILEALPLPVMIRSQGNTIINNLWKEKQPSGSEQWCFHREQLSGVFTGWEIIIAENISTQTALEQKVLTQQNDLRQLQRVKDEFLSCVTHELRSPLTVVLGMTDLLERQLVDQLTDRQRHYLKSIHRSGNRLVTVINNMIDLTKAETGQLKLHPIELKIRGVCEQVILQTQQQDFPLVPHIGLEIKTQTDRITADPNRLQQMLGHLLSNACRFTPKDTVPQVGIRVEEWESWLAFTVWDQGIGIPHEHQSRIFQKFQQLESPRTRQFDGTGLGLILTRQIARLHGGDVTFVSQANVGSEFTLLLPPSPPPPPSRQLVLIVDCSPEHIAVIAEVVKASKFYPVIARSGLEALEKARQLRPCCIFLNNDLPMLSGKDVAHLIQQDRTLSRTHIRSFQSVSLSPQDILESLPSPYNEQTILCIGCEEWEEVHELPFRCITLEDIEQAEKLAPIWKPHAIVIGQQKLLAHIYENGHLAKIPIVVKELDHNLFSYLDLYSSTDRDLEYTLKKLLRITPLLGN